MKFKVVTREEAEAYAKANKAADGGPLHTQEAGDILMSQRMRASLKAVRDSAKAGNVAKAIEGLANFGISLLDAREHERHGRGL